MASISLGEIAAITKKAWEILDALASAPTDLRKAQVKVAALKTYLGAIARETRNPKAVINSSKAVRRDAELLLGFCMAQMEEVHAISRKYEGMGASMSLAARVKWIAGDQGKWAEALVALEELRVELREYVRDVCIGVIGVNNVEAALDDTDDEEKAVDAAIKKKNKKHPRLVCAEERNDLIAFAQTVKNNRGPRNPKAPPAARLECWVVKATTSSKGVTKTWKQEKRAQANLRQMAKDLKEAPNSHNISSHTDDRVQWLLGKKNGEEEKRSGEKGKWVFVTGRVVQRGFFGFTPTETAMLIVRRNLPKATPAPKKDGKDEKEKNKKKDREKKDEKKKEENKMHETKKNEIKKDEKKDENKKNENKKDEKKKDEKAPPKEEKKLAPPKPSKDRSPSPSKSSGSRGVSPGGQNPAKEKPTAPSDKASTTSEKKTFGDCRYGSSCTNLDCKYKHKKLGPCRYGEKCNNEKCAYEHGALQCWSKVCRRAGCRFKHRAGQRGAVTGSS